MKMIACFGLFVCAAAVGMAQTNFTPISNINQPTAEQNGIWNAQTLAVSFTTSNAATVLYGVSLSLDNRNGSGGGPLNVSFYSDAGGSPGSSLRSLSGNNTPSSAGVYTFTNSTALTLSINTTYWIVASSSGSANTSAYEWNLNFSSTLDASSFWTLGVTKYNSGSKWNSAGNGVYQQFSVIVTNPTAPTIAISQPIVLIYPESGFPFTLQQTSNLNTGNWVTVTNAILSGVISNQNVFILPPTAPQLFYRLELQQ